MSKFVLLAMSTASILLAATPALAASDYYLKLGGVQGESTKQAAAGTIEVSSFSWGASDSSAARAGTGGGAGKVAVQDLSATSVASPRDAASGLPTGKRTHKPVAVTTDGQAAAGASDAPEAPTQTVSVVIPGTSSSTTQALDRACATGEHIKNAELGGKGARYQMTDVVVSSCSVSGNARKYEFRGHITLLR